MAVPIVGKLSKPNSNRIAVLETRIKWLENYSRGNNHGSYHKNNDLKQLRQELAELLEEDAKADKLRSLPLYSCKITGWKFVCKIYYNNMLLQQAWSLIFLEPLVVTI
jgi:hypothetical protein